MRADDSREEERHLLVVADLAGVAQGLEPRETGRPRVVDVDAGRFPGGVVGRPQSVLADDDRAAAGGEHPLDDGEPVVGLVVEDPVRDRVRLVLPRPHELGAVARGVAEAAGVRRDRVERALQRPRALGLDGVDLRRGGDRAELRGLAQAADAGAREGAAADLDHEPVERDAGGGELPAERLAALDREPVQVALAGERERAPGHGLEQAVVGRVAGDAGPAGADLDLCAQRLEPGEHGGVRVGGDEDLQRPAAGRRDDRRGERGVAAGGDREVGPVVRQAEPLGDLEPDQDAEEVARLVRAGDVARLVLDPDPAAGGEAEPVGELLGTRERRLDEAVPVDARDLAVERADDVDELVVAEPEAVRVQQVAVADERVRLVAPLRERDPGEVELAPEDVVDVAGAGVRAEERVRVVRLRDPAAARANQAAPPGHTASRTPVFALNSSIRSSQSATIERIPVQKAGSRRASNSSSEKPCCSTQV